ncbi:MAG: hypothetical protein ABIH23_10720, partial [bacterium]
NLAQPVDFQAMLEQRISQMEKDVASGEIDTTELQDRLQSRFGDVVNEAFGEDGSVDFDKLLDILQSQAPQAGQGPPPGMMPGMSSPPMGPPPDGAGQAGIDSSDLQSKLIQMFGKEAEGIVNEDGELDAERLQELIEQRLNSTSGTFNAFGMSDSANTFSLMDPMFFSTYA